MPLGEDGAHDDIHALTLELRRHVLHGLAALCVLAESPHDRLDFAQHDASVLQRTHRLQTESAVSMRHAARSSRHEAEPSNAAAKPHLLRSLLARDVLHECAAHLPDGMSATAALRPNRTFVKETMRRCVEKVEVKASVLERARDALPCASSLRRTWRCPYRL